MTSTPTTPGAGVPDDHDPAAHESGQGTSEPEAAEPEQHGADADDPARAEDPAPAEEPVRADDDANADLAEDPTDDPADEGAAGDRPAGDAAADHTSAEDPVEESAADGAPAEDAAAERPAAEDAVVERPGAEDAPAEDTAPDGDRTQPDLEGPAASAPERHGGHVLLGGRYELGDVLGTGATFTVYEARSTEEAAAGEAWPLVVKVLHPHLVDDDFSRAALAREVTASSQVVHPGVVAVLATGEDDVAGAVVPWTVMRRFPGTLLSDEAAGGGLPWQTALAVVADLLDGLAAVHAAGLVHRDIAPRNVIVDGHEDGTYGVGLLDLGLTAPAGGEGDGSTVSGSIIGMSPEQAKGQPLDARSDLYAVGALTYYAITGHAPFERAAAQDVLRAHVEAPVPAVSARKPVVPGAVDRIVARAMAKNPARRYADAATMAGAIRSLLQSFDGPGGRAVAAVPSGDPTLDLAQIGSDPTEKLDQVGGGTLRVGQLTGQATGELGTDGRTTVVGAYVPGGDGTSTEVLPPVLGTAGGSRPPVVPTPGLAPAPEPPPRRGRVVALVVAAVLVLGGGGLAVAGLLNGDWAQPPAEEATREASQRPKPSPSPSESSTDPVVPVAPDPEPDTTVPSPSATPSATPSAPDPEPTPEPSEETTEEPTEEPTEDPTTEPTEGASEEPTADPSPADPGSDDGAGGGTGGDAGAEDDSP